MRLALRTLVVLPVLAAAVPASAARYLYASAAQGQRVDIYAVDPASGGIGGRVDFAPVGGPSPRRVIVDDRAHACTLYVASSDRVEAFRVRKDGSLKLIGGTDPIPGMDPRDIALDPQGRYLYVPQAGPSRIAAYALESSGEKKGAPAKDFDSCVQGPIANKYETIQAASGRVYASSVGTTTRIETFDIAADGTLRGKTCSQGATLCQCTDADGDGICDSGTTTDGCVPCNPATVPTGFACNPKRLQSTLPTQCHPDPRLSEAFTVVTGTDETSETGFYLCPTSFSKDDCRNPSTNRPRVSCPTSLKYQDQFTGSSSFVVTGDQILVSQRAPKRVASLRLLRTGEATGVGTAGELTPFVCKDPSKPKGDPDRFFYCIGEQDRIARTEKKGYVRHKYVCEVKRQHASGPNLAYSTIALDSNTNTLFGVRFSDDRIDAFPLVAKADGDIIDQTVSCDRPTYRQGELTLANGPAARTAKDLAASPFRIAVDHGVVYAAGGLNNRIQAFRFSRKGDKRRVTMDSKPFSESQELDKSFPNDVVVAVPSTDDGACPR
ncbi:MAG: hypothetical protein U0807_07115 [Candidatus Binatia bacterium]